ncbi:glycine betaine ABC transporter substrate-binding protein [Planctomycetota bacterium]|nr:glycine betaine ABC transporter substrate-binding protein [Planctomycetota bacterium]
MKYSLLLMLSLGLFAPILTAQEPLTFGSKPFTENTILGEVLKQVADKKGLQSKHEAGLNGIWVMLTNGEIDAYIEYSGTLQFELFSNEKPASFDATLKLMQAKGVSATQPFGFNNTYAIGIPEKLAAELNIKTISDLAAHPELIYGFTSDFVDRADGWRAVAKTYGLPTDKVSTMDHALAYEAIAAGSIQVMDMYSTDAQIKQYKLRTLIDDRKFFPEYKAIIVYRTELEDTHPALIEAFRELEGQINDTQMVSLNARVIIDKLSEADAAKEWLSGRIGSGERTISERLNENLPALLRLTWEHILMVGLALIAATIIAVPFGFLAYQKRKLGQVVLGITGIFQTIPSIALLVLLIPFFGIGWWPAVVALFLYSLLPIVRSTHDGLKSIDPKMIESAQAIGLKPSVILRRIQFPLASRSILSGVKIAAVISVGTATLGGLIGAGGYGEMIFSGIRRLDNVQIIASASCAALLAIVLQGLFELAERAVIPKGLRIHAGD